MPGIVNLPSARVTAAYAVPDGPCTATTRAPSSGPPEESLTTPAIAAVVTPWAPSAVEAAKATVARSTNVFITSLQRDSLATGWSGRGKCAPLTEGRQATPRNFRVTAASPRDRRRRRGIPPPPDVDRNPQQDHAHVEPEEQRL